MIWKAYKYLFYQNYLSNLRGDFNWGKYAPMWAAGGMAYTFALYFLTLLMLILIFGFSSPAHIIDKYGHLYIIFGVPILHYFLFLHKRRYRKIIDEVSKTEIAKDIKKGKIIFWSYVAGSMISFTIGCFLMAYSVHTGFTLIKYFGFK